MLKNYLISKTKNSLREEDEFNNFCVTTNGDRYYELDERSILAISNKKRYRGIKF